MKKFFAVSFLLFVLMHTLTSQATLENAMKGRRVKDQIILFIQSENAVDFKIDFNDRNKKTLEKENYLQAQDQEFRVYVDFFNPLQYRMTTEDIEIDDELFQASNAYISVARDFLTTIGGMASVGGGGATARKSYETPVSGAPDNFVTNDPNVAELYILFRDFDSTFFGSNEGKIILNLLRKLNVDLVHSKISTDLKGAFSSLQKIKRLEEIEKAKSENSKIMSDIDKSLQDLKGVLDSLELQIASLPTSPTKIDLVEKSVLKFKVGGLKKLSEDLKDNVTKIIVKYKKIELLFDDSRIDNDEKRLKIAGIVNLNTSKRREIKITLEKINYNSEDYSISASDKKDFFIHLRKYQRFIPSVSSGVFYTSLTFNRFGTALNGNNETVVSASKESYNPLVLAAHLNFYYNSTEDLNWLLQLGVGPSKEKPVLLAGTGIIFRGLQFTLGAVWSWQARLDKLQEGQVVSGTTAIDQDIVYKFDPNPHFYIGISLPLTK